ncbi:MAG TPA: tetratricopeptide repeat protein [Stellaceae bacterium]|jgi:hypothetical protein|nr:tetratricopeptide repeat protein [Stellaceae bacterium]
MPIAGLLLVAQLICAVHAGRTGRPYYWIMLILFLPMAGMIAYVLIEILPDLTRSRTAQSAAAGVVKIFDPERDYREALRQVQIAGTTGNRALLAAQCLRSGRAEEAAALYRELLTGLHATDPDLMLGLARASFDQQDFAAAQATLERLRAGNPDYRSAEGHLLYARCLEMRGNRDDALYEYEALAAYYPGQEAKSRYALLLKETGRAEEAMRLFAEICQAVELMPKHARRVQKEWYDFARRHLAA